MTCHDRPSEDTQPFEGHPATGQAPLRARPELEPAGRIVIPAGMRAAMMVRPGDTVVARAVDGGFRIVSPEIAFRRAQAPARQVLPPGVGPAEEPIADRRGEARREAEEEAGWRRRHGLPPLA